MTEKIAIQPFIVYEGFLFMDLPKKKVKKKRTKKTAYSQGYLAAERGKSPNNNPYPIATKEWHSWERGYLQSAEEPL